MYRYDRSISDLKEEINRLEIFIENRPDQEKEELRHKLDKLREALAERTGNSERSLEDD